MFDFFTKKQNEDYESACLIIMGIENAKEFYRAMKLLDKYDFDAVALARQNCECFNSIHYNKNCK